VSLVFIGCNEDFSFEEEVVTSESEMVFTITVDSNENGDFMAFLPDGTQYYDAVTYREEIPDIVTHQLGLGKDVKIEFGSYLASKMDEELDFEMETPFVDGETTEDGLGLQRSGLYLGSGYHFTIATGRRYVAGCVRSNAYRVALHLNRYSSQVFDLHLATYNRNGYRCFGAYESVRRVVNWCTCSPVSYSQVKDIIYGALLAVGISASIAAIIATYATPVAIGALAL
jgi:hypothetical protein